MNTPPEQPTGPGPVIVGVIPHQPAQVLTQAAAFAKALGTSLVCAWVDASSYLGPVEPDGTREIVPLDPDVYESTPRESAAALEATLHDLLDMQGTSWTFEILAGEPARKIAQLAAREHAAMIVVGTREPGLGAHLEEILTGSVAVHLAHHQPCPVLVIPLHPKPYGGKP